MATAEVYILTEASGRRSLCVCAEFKLHRSWWNKDVPDPVETLAHEQVHFDIVELSARKMRQHIALYLQEHGHLDEAVVLAELGCIRGDEYELQMRFDSETHNGTSLPMHHRWAKQVQAELDRLAPYASTAADCVR